MSHRTSGGSQNHSMELDYHEGLLFSHARRSLSYFREAFDEDRDCVYMKDLLNLLQMLEDDGNLEHISRMVRKYYPMMQVCHCGRSNKGRKISKVLFTDRWPEVVIPQEPAQQVTDDNSRTKALEREIADLRMQVARLERGERLTLQRPGR